MARTNTRVVYTDKWIKSQAARVTILSASDRNTYSSVKDKQQGVIDILVQRRDIEDKKSKLRCIAKEFDEIKNLLLEKLGKYEKVEREDLEIDSTYNSDLNTLKSIKSLLVSSI